MDGSWISKKCMRNKAAEEMKEGDRSRMWVQAVPPHCPQHKHPLLLFPLLALARRGQPSRPITLSGSSLGVHLAPRRSGLARLLPVHPLGWRHPKGSPQHPLPTRTSAQAHAAAQLHTCCPDASLPLVRPTCALVPATAPGSLVAPVQPRRAPSTTCTAHGKAATWVRAPSRSPSCAFTWAQRRTWGPARSSMRAHACTPAGSCLSAAGLCRREPRPGPLQSSGAGQLRKQRHSVLI